MQDVEPAKNTARAAWSRELERCYGFANVLASLTWVLKYGPPGPQLVAPDCIEFLADELRERLGSLAERMPR